MEKHFEEKKQGRDFFFRPRNSFKKAGDKFLFIHNNECITITFWYGNEFANARGSDPLHFENPIARILYFLVIWLIIFNRIINNIANIFNSILIKEVTEKIRAS